MGSLYEWSWPGALLGYAWLGLLAGLLFFWQRRRPAAARASIVPPVLFCGLTTALQQGALVAAIATGLVQSWHGLAVLAIEVGVLLGAAWLWLRAQEKGRPLPKRAFAALLGAACLPLAFALINGAGWSAPPADRPVVVERAAHTTGGPIRYWFVRVSDLGEFPVVPATVVPFADGGPGVLTVGRGLLGSERATALRVP